MTVATFTDWTGRLLTLTRDHKYHNGVRHEVISVRVGNYATVPSVQLTPEQAREAGQFLVGVSPEGGQSVQGLASPKRDVVRSDTTVEPQAAGHRGRS